MFGSFEIRRTSTVEQVADVLRARILRGELPPGTPLREIGLAESMGVARNTVREGVRRLEAEGLVTHRIHRGVVVATLAEPDIHEIFEIRRFVEFEALRRCSAADVRRFVELAEGMVAMVPGGEAASIVDADMRFHQAIVDSLGNSRLSAFFANTLAELRIALCFVETGDASVWAPLHLEVCRLLETGQRLAAIELFTAHFAETEALLASTVAGPSAGS
jgi:DNA-binding GntR family transcriptional regulator